MLYLITEWEVMQLIVQHRMEICICIYQCICLYVLLRMHGIYLAKMRVNVDLYTHEGLRA